MNKLSSVTSLNTNGTYLRDPTVAYFSTFIKEDRSFVVECWVLDIKTFMGLPKRQIQEMPHRKVKPTKLTPESYPEKNRLKREKGKESR